MRSQENLNIFSIYLMCKYHNFAMTAILYLSLFRISGKCRYCVLNGIPVESLYIQSQYQQGSNTSNNRTNYYRSST